MAFTQLRARLQAAVFGRLGEDALWNGAADPIRVRFASEDEVARFGDGGGFVVGSMLLKVRPSDVAVPVEGDTVELLDSARTVRVSGEAMRDKNGVWTCPVVDV